ncbi:multicopper oxidase family protein [Cryobacterium glaciale]|uniref:Multicopper oxidase family protein n=1 Tax=Cryobacterium glaciale TaxID=1259145 RepID=A0A4R8UTE1_9MICO|nr:multicopper oxidase family protein [Cryobacterium glaciale]TFB71580.1 multicopper oxidase family protein [Cryobacterium glaciale]
MTRVPATTNLFSPATLTRRTVVGAGLSAAALLALTACSPQPQLLSPQSAAVRAAEKRRLSSGNSVKVDLRASETTVDLAGTLAATWSYGALPAATIRTTQGDLITARVVNDLPEATTVHWHGIALRNDMDGAPHLTQDPIPPQSEFNYQFLAPNAGTYWFHPHVGTQRDRGLLGALIIEDPHEPLVYDDEWVVVLDDWIDGVNATPPEIFAELSQGMRGASNSQSNIMQNARSSLLRGHAGDVKYPHYLVNGRPAADPETFRSRPGARIRIRLINAGGDTAFRVALGSHRMTITHTDGYPVEHVDVDSILLGMGERYDVLVTLGDGAFPFVAEAEGKQARGFAVVRTASLATAPASNVTVPELTGQVGTADQLVADAEFALPIKDIDRQLTVRLTGGMASYDWALDKRPFNMDKPLDNARIIRAGERVGIDFVNTTTMWHPMHLHGHTYQHLGGGPRKDTSIVVPGQTLSVIFDADNPGQWMLHCHNVYHSESGMMTTVAYEK